MTLLTLGITLLLAADGSAPPEGNRLLLTGAVELSPRVANNHAHILEALLADRLSQRSGTLLVRPEGLFRAPHRVKPEVLQKIRDLERSGNDSYMNFEFTAAAAALGEASGQLTALMGQLDKSGLALLQHILTLEGNAWSEAKEPDLAIKTFAELQTLIPASKLDRNIVGPKAQALWETAAKIVKSKGVASLRVESEPGEAEVFLDAQPRGRTPLQIADVPKGVHHLTIHKPGKETYDATVRLDADKVVRVTLQESAVSSTLRRVYQAAQHGVHPDGALYTDLHALQQEASAEDIVLAGLALDAANHEHAIVARWHGEETQPSAVVVDFEDFEHLLPAAVDVLLGPGAARTPAHFPADPNNQMPVDFSKYVLGWHDTQPVAVAVDPNAAAAAAHLKASAEPEAPPITASLAHPALSVWGGAGNSPLPNFSAEARVLADSTWIQNHWTVGVQAAWSRTTYPGQLDLNAVGLGVTVGGGAPVWRLRVGGGLKIGVQLQLEQTTLSTVPKSLHVLAAPEIAAFGRADFPITDHLFVGVQLQLGVQGLQVQETSTTSSWRWPFQIAGYAGVGWTI